MPVIGMISDIHANRDALEAVLDDASTIGVDALVCLGDVIGYGPDPGECLDLIARTCEVMIRGNHEDALVNPRLAALFGTNARVSLEFTRRTLHADQRALIDLMAPTVEVGDLSLTHATFGPDPYEYLYGAEDAERAFVAMRTPLGAIGHTHLPSIFVQRLAVGGTHCAIEVHPLAPSQEVAFERGTRVIVNPGSVGQPRDRNPDASWGVLDSDRMTFQVRRVAYDVSAVQRRMDLLGLPNHLGERLRVGA